MIYFVTDPAISGARLDLDHLGLVWCVGFVFVLVMGGLGLGFG